MKKFLSIILMVFCLTTMVAFAADEISVEIDGAALEFDVAPQIINDRTMVPMRKIFETLGAQIQWDEAARKVVAVKGDTRLEIVIGSTVAKIGEEEKVLDSKPLIIDGRTLVPIRFVSEALGAEVYWMGENKKVIIYSSESKMPQLFATLERTVLLKSDKTVKATGENYKGQCDVEGLKDIKDIALSSISTFALKNDGTVIKIGAADNNQYDASKWKDIACISASNDYVIGVKADGTAVMQSNKTDADKDIAEVESWTDLVDVCAGYNRFAGLKSDGTVVLNEGGDKYDTSDWTDIKAISMTREHLLGLKADGTVLATGYTNEGQGKVEQWNNIVAISAGKNHSVALKADGTVVAVGNNGYGQCNVEGWTDIISVAAGHYHTVGIKADGTVVATGLNRMGECDVDKLNK